MATAADEVRASTDTATKVAMIMAYNALGQCAARLSQNDAEANRVLIGQIRATRLHLARQLHITCIEVYV